MKEIMLNDFSTLFPACIFIFTRTLGKNIYIHIQDLFCARLFHRIAKKKISGTNFIGRHKHELSSARNSVLLVNMKAANHRINELDGLFFRFCLGYAQLLI